MSQKKPEYRNPWIWVPSLYFAQGIPYVIVMFVTVIMYKRMGISNTDIALYTSWLYLPWVIKPLWSPIVDLLKTKRWWIIIMQLIVGAGLGAVALTLPLPNFFQVTIAIFWLMAFSSATHDIAADGFYMLGLSKHQQAWFVGVRSTFYRLAMITGQGLLIILAGYIESNTGLPDVDISVNVDPPWRIRRHSTSGLNGCFRTSGGAGH
jgi:MFS transporter, PAT family, beta-lactamase induction signal transducer AmpG